ncbi:MAG: dTMP kinase [Nanoarchaeota archaeon]
MKKFIVLEGLDGSGKTTIAKRLAEVAGATYFRTPGDDFKPVRSYVDNGTPPETKLFYYLSTVFDASKKIDEERKNRPVVCDRYIWSSFVPHSTFYGEDLDFLERLFSHFTDRLVKPDHTIFLDVSAQEQLARLGIRSEETMSPSDKLCLDSKLRNNVRDAYLRIAERNNWIYIDTTSKPVEDIVDQLKRRLV